jgi:hypothetical protein
MSESKKRKRKIPAAREEQAPRKVARENCKIYFADGCTNIAVKGEACMKHGKKREHKRCSSEGCTSFVKKGGVCVKHGAKVEYKRCSSEGCKKFAFKGGVCMRHGAKREMLNQAKQRRGHKYCCQRKKCG